MYLCCPEHAKHCCNYDLPCRPSPPSGVPVLYEYLPSTSPSQSRCLSAEAAASHGTATGDQPVNSPNTGRHTRYITCDRTAETADQSRNCYLVNLMTQKTKSMWSWNILPFSHFQDHQSYFIYLFPLIIIHPHVKLCTTLCWFYNSIRLSVHLSVKLWYSGKMDKCMIEILSPSGNPVILVF